MAKKHIKKCSTSVVIREMQIKMTLRFHFIPIRMAKIKNSSDSTCWQGCGERGTLLHCWWECKLVQPLWKSIWQFLRKLGIVLPQDWTYSTLQALHICSRCVAQFSCESPNDWSGGYPKSCCLYVGYVLLAGLPCLASVGEEEPIAVT